MQIQGFPSAFFVLSDAPVSTYSVQMRLERSGSVDLATPDACIRIMIASNGSDPAKLGSQVAEAKRLGSS